MRSFVGDHARSAPAYLHLLGSLGTQAIGAILVTELQLRAQTISPSGKLSPQQRNSRLTWRGQCALDQFLTTKPIEDRPLFDFCVSYVSGSFELRE